MKLKVVVHPAEEGGFWAEVLALPGCVSQGETYAETLANIREAAEGWLEVADERSKHDAHAQLEVIGCLRETFLQGIGETRLDFDTDSRQSSRLCDGYIPRDYFDSGPRQPGFETGTPPAIDEDGRTDGR